MRNPSQFAIIEPKQGRFTATLDTLDMDLPSYNLMYAEWFKLKLKPSTCAFSATDHRLYRQPLTLHCLAATCV